MNSHEQSFFDDEIDLRELGITLLRYKWLLLVATLLTATVAYITSTYFSPKQYQSTAVVAVIDIGLGFRFLPAMPEASKLASIAQSNEITSRVDGMAAGVETGVSIDGDDRIRLLVTTSDPDRSAKLANEWSHIFATFVDDEYGIEKIKSQFDATLGTARQVVDDAESKLKSALVERQNSTLVASFEQAKAAWDENFSRKQENQAIIEIAQSLDAKWAIVSPEDFLSLSQTISLLGLQQREIGGGVLLVTPDLLLEEFTIAQARLDLAALTQSCQEQNRIIEVQLENLETEINSYRAQLDLAESEIAAYTLERNLALESYSKLETRFIEAQVFLPTTSPVAEITAEAQASAIPVGLNRLANTVLAGAAGLLFSVFGVFFVEWWRNSKKYTDRPL